MLNVLDREHRRSYLLLIIGAYLYFSGLSFMLLLPKYLQGLGASETELGWVVGIPLIPFLLFSPVTGALADRFPPRWIMAAGMITAAVSHIALLAADGVGPLVYALRVLHGVGHAMAFTAMFSAVAKTLPPERKAEGVGYFTVMVQLGNISGSFMASLVLESLPALWFFVLATALPLLALVPGLAARPADRAHGTARPPGGLGVLRSRPVVGALVLILVLGGAFGMVLQFGPPYLEALERTGSVRSIPSYYLLTTILATVAAVRLLLGARVFRAGNEPLLSLCMVGLAAAIAALGLIGGVASTIAVSIVFGFTYGLLFPAVNGLGLTRAGSGNQGKVAGLLTSLYEIGFRGFGFLMGPVAEFLGYPAMFLLLAALMVTGYAVFFALEADRARWLPWRVGGIAG